MPIQNSSNLKPSKLRIVYIRLLEMIAIPPPIEVAPVGAPRYRCAAPAELRREEWPANGLGATRHKVKAPLLLEE